MLTFGSLFAGIGGFDLGFERAGMRCKWQVERNQNRLRVLERQWPGVERHDDIQTFPPSWGSWDCDVICGGPPCQRTSIAACIQGKRTGETMWPEMFRVVGLIKPRIVVVEQPPAGPGWEAQVKTDLAGIGYAPTKLQRSASDDRAPHRRRRVFIVAHSMQERRKTMAWQQGPPAIAESAWPSPPRGAWREARTGSRGVDDGFSDWVDRLEALGDAVCPVTAEWIGKRIIESIAP